MSREAQDDRRAGDVLDGTERGIPIRPGLPVISRLGALDNVRDCEC